VVKKSEGLIDRVLGLILPVYPGSSPIEVEPLVLSYLFNVKPRLAGYPTGFQRCLMQMCEGLWRSISVSG